jgi:hypothetical protein
MRFSVRILGFTQVKAWPVIGLIGFAVEGVNRGGEDEKGSD